MRLLRRNVAGIQAKCGFFAICINLSSNGMLLQLRIPKTLLWVLNLLIIYVLLFTLFRFLLVVMYLPGNEPVSSLFPSFWLGLRYDLRWISVLLLPIVLLSTIPQFSPYYSEQNKKVWTWYLAITTFFVVLIYTIDFGCFSYYRVRLGATVFNFADDAAIATVMLWESYPVVWMIFGLVLMVLLMRLLFHPIHSLNTGYRSFAFPSSK